MSEKPGFLEAYSPWSSRSTSPKPGTPSQEKEKAKDDSNTIQKGHLAPPDHSISNRSPLSSQDYPKDCPKLMARWFYATDTPKRKADYSSSSASNTESLPKPKKYSAFSAQDSYAIEAAFQTRSEKEGSQPTGMPRKDGESKHQRSTSLAETKDDNQGASVGLGTTDDSNSIKVPVNEDFLFDVDIEKRELGPAYWLGPIYDVRRGSWFFQEGSTLRPCDENLSGQLEQGYIKIKPWQNTLQEPTSKPKSRPTSMVPADTANAGDGPSISTSFELQTQRLFGAYMNSVVTYQDATTAWLLTDDFLSRMSSTVYQRFAGGGHLGGVKVVRGYTEANKAKEAKKDGSVTPEAAKRRSGAPEDTNSTIDRRHPVEASEEKVNQEDPSILKLERQMSNLDPAMQEAEARERDEVEIKEDYRQVEGEDQNREIEHLLLVTHGIGQKLGLRLEMLNFIADVNTLRKTIKTVYQSSQDLQLLNAEIDNPKNSRIQVLPVVWRHLLDFPAQSFKNNREQDVADATDDEEYPSLDSITLEPPTIIRTAIRDLGLDILMYQSAYREHISETVVRECNRVYEIFRKRNPEFRGRVSLIGHSLGSAILFDVLCQQKDRPPPTTRSRTQSLQNKPISRSSSKVELKFDVEDYYCLGSPLGLYQMLNGRKIAGRRPINDQKKWDGAPIEDPFLGASSPDTGKNEADLFAISKSAPKCAQLFNIFHPADPIAYRLEPLISTAMASLKPQPLPYTKKGIFDVQGQGLSAISNRVGQSVSGLWSSVTGGMASTLLNRTLGLPAESQAKVSAPQIQQRQDSIKGLDEQVQDYQHAPTLIDNELETLYAGFEKSRKIKLSDDSRDLGESSQWGESEKRSKRLKREEAKVRALNSNGRVDFAIQT